MSANVTPIDPRVDKFLAAFEALTHEQWETVCRRYLRAEAAIGRAFDDAYDLAANVATGKVAGRGQASITQRREAAKRARARAHRIVESLPERVGRGPTELALRDLAKDAVGCAMEALVVWEELTRRKGGQASANKLLSPFKGLVPEA